MKIRSVQVRVVEIPFEDGGPAKSITLMSEPDRCVAAAASMADARMNAHDHARDPSLSTSTTQTRFRFVTLALITLVLALSTGDRAALSVAGSGMAKELGISSVEMGYLFSACSWAYVIFLIPSGPRRGA